MTRKLTLFFAAACGLIVANLYFAQPIAADMGADLGMSPALVGLLVTFTQIGYALGLLLVAPLGDGLENRRLISACLAAAAAALIGLSFAPNAASALFFAALVGVCCASAQIIVPFAASLASEAKRGEVVGDVMSGLMVGIMLSRPAAAAHAHWLGWRSVFLVSGLVMAALSAVFFKVAPSHPPRAELSYGAALRSLVRLLRETPALRWRIGAQAPLFAAFSLFWTAVPLALTGQAFGLTQQGVALFALIGAGGAVMAPIVGRAKSPPRPLMAAALLSGVVSFALAYLGVALRSMVILAIAAIVLDMAVSANLILSQRMLFALGETARSRLNALFIASFFFGGAIGSALSTASYAWGGWLASCAVGAGFVLLALASFLAEGARAARRA